MERLVRRRLDPGNPPKLSPETSARLDGFSPDVVAANAHADPDNPSLSDAEFYRAGFAQEVRRARIATGLSQGAFADRYGINPARLRDWEQGRYLPDSVARAYLKVIAAAPNRVAEVFVAAAPVRAA
jgi:putative transcriptional regulator